MGISNFSGTSRFTGVTRLTGVASLTGVSDQITTPPATLPTVSAAPQAVYGTTLLVAGYTGYCCKVNRASDNAQLDIGFVSGRIDMGAANAFRGASELTIVTWYDQSGNGYDATNATVANQPRLRSENAWRGLQGILFDGFAAASGGTQIAKTLTFPAGVTINRQSQTAFLVNGVKATGAGNAVLEMGVLATRALPFTGVGNTGLSILTGSTGMLTTRLPRSNPSVNAWRMGAAASKVYVEDDISTSGAAQAAGSSTAGQFGSSVSGAAYNHRGEIYAFVEYASALSDGDVTLVNAALKSAYSCDYSQPHLIFMEGDSGVEGTGDTYMMNNIRQCYPNLIQDAHIYNMAVHGTTAATEYARRVAKFDSVNRTVTGKKIFICSIGSNDISSGTTANNLWTNTILPYIQYAKSRGYTVLMGTIIPRGDFSAPTEAERIVYNLLVTSNATAYNYYVADYCAQPEFDTQADASNTTYYTTDTVHPNSTGYGVMASVLYPVINTIMLATAFAPTDIANMGAWWDASDTSSITAVSNAVSQINDKSGNANHATQATGSLQPLSGTRTVNGRNVLDFDGVDDTMTVTLATLGSLTNGANTIFSVSQYDAGALSRYITGSSTAAAQRYGFYGVVGTWGFIHAANATQPTTGSITTSPTILIGTRSGTAVKIRQNGGAGASNTSGVNFTLEANVIIGQGTNSDGAFAESIIYSRLLTTAEINQVLTYLSAKWGILTTVAS